MQTLRHARFLAHLVLAWFALSLGAAIASPLVKGGDLELVCSGTGALKLVAKGAPGGQPAHAPTLDCPLCAGLDAPPSIVSVEVPFVPALAHVVRPVPAARIAALVAAPLSARGPPSFRSA